MAFGFVIARGRKVPYMTVSGWSCTLNDYADTIAADGGECRCTDFGRAGFYLALVKASAATLNTIDADPNCVVIPASALGTDLGSLTNAQKNRLKNVLNAAGYTGAELQAALGANLAGVTLFQLLKFVMSLLVLPVYDPGTDSFSWTGNENDNLPVPGLELVGGSPIMDQPPGVLDNFNRADASTLGGIWTPNMRDTANSPRILTNQVANPTSGTVECNAYVTGFSATDIDSGVTVAVTSTTADLSVFSRVSNPGGVFTGYQFFLHNNANVQMWRGVAGSFAQIGVSTTYVASAGDKIRVRNLGTSLIGYTKTAAGAWVAQITQTDGNVTAAGVIGFEIAATALSNASRLDDFFGDAIPMTPYMARGAAQAVLGSASV